MAIESPGTPLFGVLRHWTWFWRGRRVYFTNQAGNARRHGERNEACGPPSPSVS